MMDVSKEISKKLQNARTTTLLGDDSTGRAWGRGDGDAVDEVEAHEEVVDVSPQPDPTATP